MASHFVQGTKKRLSSITPLAIALKLASPATSKRYRRRLLQDLAILDIVAKNLEQVTGLTFPEKPYVTVLSNRDWFQNQKQLNQPLAEHEEKADKSDTSWKTAFQTFRQSLRIGAKAAMKTYENPARVDRRNPAEINFQADAERSVKVVYSTYLALLGVNIASANWKMFPLLIMARPAVVHGLSFIPTIRKAVRLGTLSHEAVHSLFGLVDAQKTSQLQTAGLALQRSTWKDLSQISEGSAEHFGKLTAMAAISNGDLNSVFRSRISRAAAMLTVKLSSSSFMNRRGRKFVENSLKIMPTKEFLQLSFGPIEDTPNISHGEKPERWRRHVRRARERREKGR